MAAVDAALRRVPPADWPALQDFIAGLAGSAAGSGLGRDGAYLSLLRNPDAALRLKVCAGMVNARCRQATLAPPLAGTEALADDLALLAARLQAWRSGAPLLAEMSDGRFAQFAHEVMLGRGAQPAELMDATRRLASYEMSREALLAVLAQQAAEVAKRDAERRSGEGGEGWDFHVMGTDQRVTQDDWQARLLAVGPGPHPPPPTAARLELQPAARRRVSAITSLYGGGAHIERFMANIVGQSCFRDHAELVIVDACSPDGERAVIERYRREWPENIQYLRTSSRIGIYEAWNLAVQMARGDYLTSANVDDLRRADSLERQAAVLDHLPFVDVVYQDFFYTMDPALSFEHIAAMGYKAELPLVTPHGLMQLNPPHNAPMWRRRLHDELGVFDTAFVSAGDYDFWMRCALAGKTFYKLNDPHLAYYQNPQGLSTRRDTHGHEETRAIHRRYGRQLVSAHLLKNATEFAADLADADADADAVSVGSHRAAVHRALCRLGGTPAPKAPP